MADPIDLLLHQLRRLEALRLQALRRGDCMVALGITRRKAELVGILPPVGDGMTERFGD